MESFLPVCVQCCFKYKYGNDRITAADGDDDSNTVSSDEVYMSLSSCRFTSSGTILTSSEEIKADFIFTFEKVQYYGLFVIVCFEIHHKIKNSFYEINSTVSLFYVIVVLIQ